MTKSSKPSSAQSAEPSKSGHQKGAATMRRRKDERREESLRQIREQTADGTLVIRQMTVAQHKAASEVANDTRARNESRRRRPRPATA